MRKHITVFEHQSIRVNDIIDGTNFDKARLKGLQSYYGERGVPYFSLIHNGVRFNQFVGVIQVGDTVIEVLPKADNSFAGANEKKQWRDILIDMLFAVNGFDLHAPSSSTLKLKSNSILDLYFSIFIKEVQYLLHTGLVKRYRKKEGNVTALKGSLLFSKNIQHNVTHQERFYVRHTNYDVYHKLHFILHKTIRLLQQLNTNVALHSSIGTLLLHFPEMPDIKITEATFDKLVFTRKTQSYKRAIEIARLLLLHYHPDVSRGRNDVLALMFDMNLLWEQFIYATLRKHKATETTISSQTSKYFWQPQAGNRSKIRPDIVINKGNKQCLVLDTKWKNLNGYNPSSDDLRQMYIYHEYYKANKVALVYPGNKTLKTSGCYLDPVTSEGIDKECSIVCLSINPKIKQWQENIYKELQPWITLA